MPSSTILVVDYEKSNLEKLKSLLEAHAFRVETATDGKMAVEQVEATNPNLVLLAAMLPRLHGFDACKQIKSGDKGAGIPVVIMTRIYRGRKYRHDALTRYGASEYVEMPIDDDALLDTVKRVLDGGGEAPQLSEEPVKEPTEDVEIPELIDDDEDEIPELLDDEEEALLGDDEQTVTVDPDVAEAVIARATEEAEENRELTAREIFADVISEVEQEVGEPLKRIALQRASQGAAGAKFLDTGASEATQEPEQETETEEMEDQDALQQEEEEEVAPEPIVEETPPKPKKPRKAITEPLPRIDEIVEETKPKPTRKPAAASQDIFKQKLEETLTGLGIPVRKKIKKKKPKEKPKEEPPAPAPASPSATAKKPAEGVRFGNYTLLEKIAAGGMAELFRARMQGVEGFRKVVAIKRILPHLTDNEEFVNMFIDEAKLAAQLNHQNIAHIFDLGHIEKFYYIAMEYVAGLDLRTILKRLDAHGSRLPVEIAVLIASKVAAALDYAHRKKDFDGHDLNIVHRDISPQNIIISYEGEVKLVDFGIAKAVSRSSQTESGTVKGKLLYMSPEQARGVEIDKRSDIFSLGVVLYESLTGKKLFMADTEMDIIRKVRDCKIRSPRKLLPAVPKELDLVVMTALEKRPDDRYQNAYKMEKDLENIMYSWESTPTSVNLAQYMADTFQESDEEEEEETVMGLDLTPASPPPVMPAAPPSPQPPAPAPRPISAPPVPASRAPASRPPASSLPPQMMRRWTNRRSWRTRDCYQFHRLPRLLLRQAVPRATNLASSFPIPE